MTKRNYTAIAKIIADSKDLHATKSRATARKIADKLADYFEQDNTLFNRKRFLTACGLAD